MSNTTILTPTLFTTYCDNYFLGTSAPKNILNGHITQQLPTIIKNVETSLNSMLNGRLYNKYNPANLTFNGNNILSPTVEQETLYSLLTEAVLYKIQTGTYVNVQNNFGGNVNGSNNFNTSNSNVVGLRNDIRDKLVLLGLYKNANFANATTPNVYAAASPGVNQGPLTMQSLAQLNTYLSTNNFTLGGKWDFANLLINGTPINTYIDNQVNVEAPNYNSVLINYLPNTPIPAINEEALNAINQNGQALQSYSYILQKYYDTKNNNYTGFIPLITSADILKWNNAAISASGNVNTLQNYINGPIPLITQIDINLWNNAANGATAILQNYWPNTVLPTITQTDITNWNNSNTILKNYSPSTEVPLITQADITKWNSNSGSSSGSTVTRTTYTLTITNKWSINFSNYGQMELTESTAVWSPDPTANNILPLVKPTQTLPQTSPYIQVSLLTGTGTLLSAMLYPTNDSNYNSWTNISNLSLPNDWYTNTMLEVYSGNGYFVYANWNTNGYGNASPVYIANNGLIQTQLNFNYYVDYSGSGTAPSSPTQTFTEVATFMIDVVIAK